ncbi:hypothetical protein QPM17_23210 [Marinobacter sp. TBZ242]|uniref:Uncharacterized protein n=1 Tax=Marinobacter azerbaijanicus TaxID=3050455 RepID=A0ABT7IK33_9GAMM|nr:hypothetical protein [Marinobacter sp. TBZ242]MDL0434053.1 hypothetical protein [Marinobacter sp. TBZ242]
MMSFRSDFVVIMTRTAMSGGICVGAYDVVNEKMIRLLDNRAGRLTADAPYQIGEVYSMVYAERYNLIPPHAEDVAVYEAEYRGECPDDYFDGLVNDVTVFSVRLSELFDGKLHWESSGFILEDDLPGYSVQIATLQHPLMRDDDYFRSLGLGGRKRIKYVGEKPIRYLPMIIQPGVKIRFSLARFWDKGDGVKRAYLQISGIY